MHIVRTVMLLFVFLFSFTSLKAQLTIQGTVTDTKTGETVPGVNVYLANTTFGSSTNPKGVYQINNIPSGVYVLVFSFVGYKTRAIQLKAKNSSSSRTLDIKLKPQTLVLNEVKVVSSNKEWIQNYERFKKAFIGQTEFAKRTFIENPWVINFTNDTETDNLVATANKPLIIINKALGYKIYAELVAFNWSKYQDVGVYKIYPKFEPLTPQNKRQDQMWWENRIKTYLGSLSHFMKIIHSEDIGESNFSVKGLRKLSLLTAGETKYVFFEMGYSQGMTERFKGFKLDDKIQVDYKYRTHYQFGKNSVPFSINKKNHLSTNKENELFFVDKNGALLDPASIIVYGNWARSRVANDLPNNYEIEN